MNNKDYSFNLNADGTLADNQSTPIDTTYGKITLANGENGITYTYTQTKKFSHHDEENPDEAESAESFTVKVQDSSGKESESEEITVTIEDDAPVFTDESSKYDEVTNSEDYWSTSKRIDFASINDEETPNGKNSTTIDLGDGNRATFYTGKVTFERNRIDVANKDQGWDRFVDENSEFYVYDGGKLGIHSGDGWGYDGTVDSNLKNNGAEQGRRDEIGYDYEGNQAEAVIIHLSKPALNLNIAIKDFFGGTDEGEEAAVFLFYKNGVLVGESHLSSETASGNVQADGFTQIPPGGFDTVVIASTHNGVSDTSRDDNSEFSIGSITFNEFENPPVRTLTGELEAKSADGIESYGIDVKALGKLGLDCKWSEDGKLVATAGGETIFEISLDTGSGAWTMIQYKEYMDGELKLPFTATDGDGDTTLLEVPINAPVIPSTETLDVYEAGMTNGSEPGSVTHSFIAEGHLTLEEGATSVSIGDSSTENNTITLGDGCTGKFIELENGDIFTITNYGDGRLDYTYTLNHSEHHPVQSDTKTATISISVGYGGGASQSTDVTVNIHDDDMKVYVNHERYHDDGRITARSADGVTYSFDADAMPDEVGFLHWKKDVSWDVSSDGDRKILTGKIEDGRQVEEIFRATLYDDGYWKITKNDEEIDEIHFTVKDDDGDVKDVSIDLLKDYSGEYARRVAATEKTMSRAVAEAATAAALTGMLADLPQDAEAAPGGDAASPEHAADDSAIPAGETAESLPDTATDKGADTQDDSLSAPGMADALADGTETLEALLSEGENGDFTAEGPLFAAAAGADADGALEPDGTAAPGTTPDGETPLSPDEEGIHGTDGDDVLSGTEGDDILFGMGGDDYIDGGAGRDSIFGGDGDDIIVYDSNDYLVHGGSGIDFMVSDDAGLTLESLLTGTGQGDGPIVKDVEVLITGKDALSLTSIDQLAEKYGITLGTGENGEETLSLDMDKWQANDEGGFTYTGQDGADLTLETTLEPVSDAQSDAADVQQQVFLLSNSNG